MRTQLLESFRTKHVTENLFWPMLMLDFFDALPEYCRQFEAAGHEYDDTVQSIAIGPSIRYALGVMRTILSPPPRP